MSRTKLLVSISLFIGLSAWGQTTDSPYSFYGLGDVNSRAFAAQRSTGSAGVAQAKELSINQLNSASYAEIQNTTFAVDMNWDFKTIRSDLVSQNTRRLYFNNLAIAFPVGVRGGISAGVRQFTKIGYNIQSTQTDPLLGKYEFQYDGNGGINEFNLGGAFSLIRDSNQTNTLSIGANLLYYFGFAETNRRTTNFEATDGMSSNQREKSSVNDFSFDLGLYYKRRIDTNLQIAVGVNYSPAAKINSKNTTFAYTYRDVAGDEAIKDTIQFSETKGSITMPSNLRIGLNVLLGNSWSIMADYNQQNWSELDYNASQDLNDRQEYAVGVESIPDPDASSKYFKQVNYRAGFRYAQTRLNVNNYNINEYAMSAGIGLPVVNKKIGANSKSYINIGIEFGQRGTRENGLVQENFTNLYFGISFIPTPNNKWFQKVEYK